MSAPPISSPRTKTCGIVGQLDTAESSCRIRGSGRTSTAVTGAPAARSASSAREEFPHMTNWGVPFMNRATSSDWITFSICSRSSLTPFRLDAQLVNRAIAEGGCEGLIDQPVLLDQRQAVEARARDRDLEVIA